VTTPPMSAAVAHRRQPARLDSPATWPQSRGARMKPESVLDVVERLLLAAQHPDIVAVERYGPGLGPWGPSVEQSRVKAITGVKVIHQSTATASLWEAIWPGEQAVPVPDKMPPPNQRAPRLPILVAQLLDYAKPEQFRAWRLVSLPNIGMSPEQDGMPFGLSIALADGTKVLLRATATGPTMGQEPSQEPFPDYVIPEGVRTCLQAVNAANAEL
jgi:hypothetical protein